MSDGTIGAGDLVAAVGQAGHEIRLSPSPGRRAQAAAARSGGRGGMLVGPAAGA